jgi:hypothetical protein
MSEQSVREQQLGTADVGMRRRPLGCGGVAVAFGRQICEHSPAQGVVDRPAVVGVDKTEVPEFAALVDVGHSRTRQQQRGLHERVQTPALHDAVNVKEVGQVGDEAVVTHDRRHERRDGLVVVGLRLDP